MNLTLFAFYEFRLKFQARWMKNIKSDEKYGKLIKLMPGGELLQCVISIAIQAAWVFVVQVLHHIMIEHKI